MVDVPNAVRIPPLPVHHGQRLLATVLDSAFARLLPFTTICIVPAMFPPGDIIPGT